MTGLIDPPKFAKINQDDTPYYNGISDSNPSKNLRINSSCYITEAHLDRLKIELINDNSVSCVDRSVGWIDRKNLQCSLTPSISKDGYKNRFFIKKCSINNSDKTQLYSTPIIHDFTSDFINPQCFDLFYIYDRCDNRYLISDSSYLSKDSNLIGWVIIEDGFIWNNPYSVTTKNDVLSIFFTKKSYSKNISLKITVPPNFRMFYIKSEDSLINVLFPKNNFFMEGYVKNTDVNIEILYSRTDIDVCESMISCFFHALEREYNLANNFFSCINMYSNNQIIYNPNKTLKAYLREFVKLPIGPNSALFDYSMEDFRTINDQLKRKILKDIKAFREILRFKIEKGSSYISKTGIKYYWFPIKSLKNS